MQKHFFEEAMNNITYAMIALEVERHADGDPDVDRSKDTILELLGKHQRIHMDLIGPPDEAIALHA